MNNGVYHYITPDKRFGIIIEKSIIDKMKAICAVKPGVETGGILIGCYNEGHDKAIVSKITPAPKDSIHENCHFYRGIMGLQSLLDRFWKQNKYYLGEWHYHPYSSPLASSYDLEQLKTFSEKLKLNCPEPIMIIMGGDPLYGIKIKSYIAIRNKSVIEMDDNNV